MQKCCRKKHFELKNSRLFQSQLKKCSHLLKFPQVLYEDASKDKIWEAMAKVMEIYNLESAYIPSAARKTKNSV